MSQQHFSHLLLIGRPNTEGVPNTLTTLCEYLEQLNVTISIEAETAQLFSFTSSYQVVETTDIPSNIDLIIVVGGDGSMIQAAHSAMQHDIPILGINRGRLGFLTDIDPEHIDAIGKVINGEFKEERRFFINAEINSGTSTTHHLQALNDIVLFSGNKAQLIEFHTYVNQELLYHQRADGLIIATPTGSTAYALSGGGPILTPGLDAYVIVPMHPHTLSSRPIVIPATSEIKITIDASNTTPPQLSNDGKNSLSLAANSEITITQYKKTLRLIHPKSYSYFTTLREKLGWERQARRA